MSIIGDIWEERYDKMEAKYKALIAAQKTYIEFLGENIIHLAGLAQIHDYECPQDVVDTGEKLRNEIEQLSLNAK